MGEEAKGLRVSEGWREEGAEERKGGGREGGRENEVLGSEGQNRVAISASVSSLSTDGHLLCHHETPAARIGSGQTGLWDEGDCSGQALHRGTCSHLSIGVHACKCIVVLIGARCWQTRHGRVHSCLTAPLQEAGDFADVAYFVLKSRCPGGECHSVCVCVCVPHSLLPIPSSLPASSLLK